MKLLRGSEPFVELTKGCVATIGNFDGVHIGHQALLSQLRKKANALNLPLLVILFEPQPQEYFNQDNPPPRLSSLREKISMLQRLDVDYSYCLSFDKRLSLMEADQFAKRFLLTILNIKYLLVGQDFRFGKNRAGDVYLLERLFKAQARQLYTFADFKIANERVSSTKIRSALGSGNLVQASLMLGRHYSMCGRVIKGDGRGRQWGIPTANIGLNKKILPLTGVYCVTINHARHGVLLGVANVGCRPTVDGSKNILEIHILDFDKPLYGNLIEVVFLHKLRNEVKFSSVDALIAKIKADIDAARSYFNGYNHKE